MLLSRDIASLAIFSQRSQTEAIRQKKRHTLYIFICCEVQAHNLNFCRSSKNYEWSADSMIHPLYFFSAVFVSNHGFSATKIAGRPRLAGQPRVASARHCLGLRSACTGTPAYRFIGIGILVRTVYRSFAYCCEEHWFEKCQCYQLIKDIIFAYGKTLC